MLRSLLLSTTALLVAPAIFTPALAQSAADNTSDSAATNPVSKTSAPSPTSGPDGDDFHVENEIVVTAPYLRDLNIFAGTAAISGDTLAREIRPQIGDTLNKLPGVSSTSFTPGASRPVLRGFQGERVRILTDGIGTIDVSNTSADHAVTIEPLTLERIEVLHGPAVLLFGGQAIGGAVNAIDKRIPRKVPEEPFHLDALVGYATASNDRNAAASLDVPVTPKLVAHVDGSYRNSDDLDVGGYVLSPALRSQQLAIAAQDRIDGFPDAAAKAEAQAALRGTIPNTATETYNLGAGLSFIDDGGMIGVSASYFNSRYGVPDRPSTDLAIDTIGQTEEGPVVIGLDQFKLDLRAQADLPGFFNSITVRAAYADFKQTEFAGDEIGTIFTNQGMEGRLELAQADHGGWQGASGLQYVYRNFDAIGDEAFVPANITEQFGAFTLQEYKAGRWDFEASGRYDRQVVKSNPINAQRAFNAFSFALGGSYSFTDALKIGATLSRSERAPSAEELFSNGPHGGTQAYEIGNPDFTTEKSRGGEAYLRYSSGPTEFSLTGYLNDFTDFIIDVPTSLEQDGLPVFQYIQTDARYYGFEAQASTRLTRIGSFAILADGVADYVHAQLKGTGPVPRIPPLRILGGLEAQSDNLNIRGEVEWFDKQNRVASQEIPTDSFTLVNASVAWKPFGKEGGVTLLASADNIFDVVGRTAASFTKDFAPIAGRDFRISAKFSF